MNDTKTVRIIIEIPIRKDESISMPTVSPVVTAKEVSAEPEENDDLVDIREMSPNELNAKLKENQPAPHEVAIGEDGSVTDVPPTTPVVPDSSNTPPAPIDPQHFEEQVE